MALILIAEDDFVSLKLISSVVEKLGHTPVKTRNGAIAWAILEDNHVNIALLITDYMMPAMDGKELLKNIREHRKMKELPVIVQSAYLGVNGTVEFMELGADAVMPKPIDREDLRGYIRQYLP